MSSTGTALAKLYEVAASGASCPRCRSSRFYAHPGYLDLAGMMKAHRDEFKPDHILFSYHGLPERHVINQTGGQHCLASANCCDAITPANCTSTGAVLRHDSGFGERLPRARRIQPGLQSRPVGPRGFNPTPMRSSSSFDAASSA